MKLVKHQRRRHPTMSLYEGLFDVSRNVMSGYGRYIYPDGSEYRGFFRDGQFHGYGGMRLAGRHKFAVKGLFKNGKLVKVESMSFADGLRFNAKFVEKNKVDTSVWTYLTPDDRRYVSEFTDLGPVSPDSVITRQKPAREVPVGAFDTEEGIYKPLSGFIIDRNSPLSPFRYVGCKDEKQWILTNCRTNRDGGGYEQWSTDMKKEFGSLILTTNCFNENYLDTHNGERSAATKIYQKSKSSAVDYLRKLCNLKAASEIDPNDRCETAKQSEKLTEFDVATSPTNSEFSVNEKGSSTSCSSFLEGPSNGNDFKESIFEPVDLELKGSAMSTNNENMLADDRYYAVKGVTFQ